MSKFVLQSFSAAALILAMIFAGSAMAQDNFGPMPAAISIIQDNGAYILKTDDDLALYTFDSDTEDKSACNGQCAAIWPPVPATAENTPLGDWTIITRDDGSLQWAYKGKPVYIFGKDTATTISGDGMGGVWHLARP